MTRLSSVIMSLGGKWELQRQSVGWVSASENCRVARPSSLVCMTSALLVRTRSPCRCDIFHQSFHQTHSEVCVCVSQDRNGDSCCETMHGSAGGKGLGPACCRPSGCPGSPLSCWHRAPSSRAKARVTHCPEEVKALLGVWGDTAQAPCTQLYPPSSVPRNGPHES